MNKVVVEIKARTADPDRIRTLLQESGAEYAGRDPQRDTYFRVAEGRLKLREGEIENALIHYKRNDTSGPKRSDVTLYIPQDGHTLKTILTDALGVDVVVEKQREIYFIGNVKFHIDEVEGLGSFVEIEAIDGDGRLGADVLRSQCGKYLEMFDIAQEDLLADSYSDMLRYDDRHGAGPKRRPF